MSCCCLPLERLELNKQTRKQQERHECQGKNGPRVKMGCCCSLPERDEVNGQGLTWSTVVYPVKEFR